MPGFYNIIVPTTRDDRNIVLNPSFENGTTPWSGTTGGGLVFGITSDSQAFGAWCGTVASAGDGPGMTTSVTLGSGTFYTASAYVKMVGIAGGSAQIALGGTSYRTHIGSDWQRISVGTLATSTAARTLAVQRFGAIPVMYVDGVQCEAGSTTTTYIDGDQGAGYLWEGEPHASMSLRTAEVRTGGSVYPLTDLGFMVLEHDGVGMPDVTAVTQDYALIPGAFYQRTQTNPRSFLLTGLMSGTTFQDLHAIRQRVINTIKPDGVSTPQPFRIIYTGAGGSVYIDGVYDSGMQLKTPEGFSETAAVRFIAPEPYWQTILDRGTSLVPLQVIGSVNYLLKRDANWQWGTLGTAGTTTNGAITALGYRNGTVFVGGGFTTIGGTASGRLGMYLPTGSFGTLGGTVGGGTVRAIAPLPSGTVVFGGDWTLISGLTNTRFVGQWSSAGFGTIFGGTVSGTVLGLARLATGQVGVAGSYTYDANNRHFMLWDSVNAYVQPSATINEPLLAIAGGQDFRVYVGYNGLELGTATAGGTRFWGVAQYNLTGVAGWGSMGSGIGQGADSAERVDAITVGPSGRAFAVGHFASAGGQAAQNIAAWTAPAWASVGGTLGDADADFDPEVNAVVIEPRTGLIYAGGDRATPQVNIGGLAGTWSTFGFPRARENVMAMLFTPDRSLYVALSNVGIGTTSAVTRVINPGNAETPVRVRVTAPPTTPAIIDHLVNATNDRMIFFGGPTAPIAPGDNAVLVTAPGSVSYSSPTRDNRLNDIVPGSNLSEWVLMAGTNYVSTYVTPASARVDLWFKPKFWSNDGTA